MAERLGVVAQHRLRLLNLAPRILNGDALLLGTLKVLVELGNLRIAGPPLGGASRGRRLRRCSRSALERSLLSRRFLPALPGGAAGLTRLASLRCATLRLARLRLARLRCARLRCAVCDAPVCGAPVCASAPVCGVPGSGLPVCGSLVCELCLGTMMTAAGLPG